jgi:antiviral helicase SKI2
MLKRKEQVDKANGVSANARGGRGGRGGAVTRGSSRTMTRSYQSGMQTVSQPCFISL